MMPVSRQQQLSVLGELFNIYDIELEEQEDKK